MGYANSWRSRRHSEPVSVVKFSPDGTRTCCSILILYDAALEWSDRWRNLCPSKTLKLGVFSQDGTKFASSSYDTTVRLWDTRTGGEIAVIRGHSNSNYSAVFSPDGTILASASYDGTVGLWKSQTGAKIAVLQGHLQLTGVFTRWDKTPFSV